MNGEKNTKPGRDELLRLRRKWKAAEAEEKKLLDSAKGTDTQGKDDSSEEILTEARKAKDKAAIELADAELLAGEDLEEAFRILNELANQEDTRAIMRFAHMFESGEFYERNYERARECYEWADELGEPKASFCLGRLYRLGLGTEKSPRKAAVCFQRALDLDESNLEAKYQLAVLMLEFEEASEGVELLKECAERGHTDARYDYAMCLLYGDGVRRSVRKAVEILEELWKEGDGEAAEKLAYMYSAGFGVRPNPEKAARYAAVQ